MKTVSSRPILMVEDQDSDYEVTARGFRRLGVQTPLVRFTTLEESAQYLEKARASSDTDKMPGVIILDLRLGDGDGVELLKIIKQDNLLCRIPVIVWSASTNPDTVSQCYEQGANSFIRKTGGRPQAENAVESFVQYWLHTVTLPANLPH